jgi:hypothetical protein
MNISSLSDDGTSMTEIHLWRDSLTDGMDLPVSHAIHTDVCTNTAYAIHTDVDLYFSVAKHAYNPTIGWFGAILVQTRRARTPAFMHHFNWHSYNWSPQQITTNIMHNLRGKKQN